MCQRSFTMNSFGFNAVSCGSLEQRMNLDDLEPGLYFCVLFSPEHFFWPRLCASRRLQCSLSSQNQFWPEDKNKHRLSHLKQGASQGSGITVLSNVPLSLYLSVSPRRKRKNWMTCKIVHAFIYIHIKMYTLKCTIVNRGKIPRYHSTE